jgi:hypothetical protein
VGYGRTTQSDSGIVIRTVSAIVFLTFTFLWLYYFQSDVMAYSQHVFSGGVTHYNRLVGALLVTIVLWLLQCGVYAMVRLRVTLHAITYLPSMVVLVLLDAICPAVDGSSSFSLWWLLLLPVLALWGLVSWVARMASKYNVRQQSSFFSRNMWVNLLVMVMMMAGVALVTNTNAVFHFRARTETCLLEHRFDDALQVGRRSLESDASLTMLRAYTLSRCGQLGDHLFEYPVVGGGDDLLPLEGSASRLLRYSSDSLYRHLGALPRPGMDTPTFLTRLQRQGKASEAVRDYVLCRLLIDRNLDAFAKTLPDFYEVADSLPLPRHYREALTLYVHSRTNPVIVYHDAVTDEDYANLQELEAQYRDPRERHIRVKEQYQGSYWYYYEYMK